MLFNQKEAIMKRYKSIGKVAALAAVLFAMLFATGAKADDEASLDLDKSLSGLKIEVLAYIDYSAGSTPLADEKEEYYNRFALTRGYFTIKKSLNDWLGFRFTSDLAQETKAEGTKLNESYVVRIKYFYAELKPQDLWILTNMKAEIGLGHTPWLDFEEHNMNPYRCQGTMPIERAHVFNSADTGVSIRGNFGGKLEDAKAKTGNSHYDGRYGSWHIGVYNGGGYHEVENNQNKLVEGRVTLRPLPDILPGLQFSYLGIYGDANVAVDDVVAGVTLEEIPEYQVNMFMVSFEHPSFLFNGQYFTTKNKAGGGWIDPMGESLETVGYSGFVNVKIPGTDNKLNVFGRYDWFDIDPDDKYAAIDPITNEAMKDSAFSTIIAGIAYDVYKNNLLLVAWENTDYEEDANVKDKLPVADNRLGKEDKIQVVWQIKM